MCKSNIEDNTCFYFYCYMLYNSVTELTFLVCKNMMTQHNIIDQEQAFLSDCF